MKLVERKLIHEKCFVNNLQYYHKTNLIRAPLEALISGYLIVIAVMFSKWFVHRDVLTATEIVFMVLVPLLFALIVCLLYSAGVILLVNRKICMILAKITADDFKMNMDELYRYIDKETAPTFKLIHTSGALCYLAVGVFVSLRLSNAIFNGIHLTNMMIIIIYSLIMGAVWNLYGYFSDRRIDWSKIFKDPNIDISAVEDIQKEKYKFYKISVKLQVVIISVITVVLILILFNFDYQLIPADSLDILITYSAFVAWFITILKLYVKYTYKLFFARGEKGSEIFPSESEILIGRLHNEHFSQAHSTRELALQEENTTAEA